jgi:transketolase C-terminal domain/subunit
MMDGVAVNTSGPRSAFDFTVAILPDAGVSLQDVIKEAADRAVEGGVAVSEVVRVADELLTDGRWYWMVTLRVFPASARSVSDVRRTVDAGGAS